MNRDDARAALVRLIKALSLSASDDADPQVLRIRALDPTNSKGRTSAQATLFLRGLSNPDVRTRMASAGIALSPRLSAPLRVFGPAVLEIAMPSEDTMDARRAQQDALTRIPWDVFHGEALSGLFDGLPIDQRQSLHDDAADHPSWAAAWVARLERADPAEAPSLAARVARLKRVGAVSLAGETGAVSLADRPKP